MRPGVPLPHDGPTFERASFPRPSWPRFRLLVYGSGALFFALSSLIMLGLAYEWLRLCRQLNPRRSRCLLCCRWRLHPAPTPALALLAAAMIADALAGGLGASAPWRSESPTWVSPRWHWSGFGNRR